MWHPLLSQLLEKLDGDETRDDAAPSRAYLESLLAAFQGSGARGQGAEMDSRPPNPGPRSLAPHLLSQRELELLRLASEGMSTREIAADLIIAEGTVKRPLHNIYGKLGASSRTQAIATARRRGILAG